MARVPERADAHTAWLAPRDSRSAATATTHGNRRSPKNPPSAASAWTPSLPRLPMVSRSRCGMRTASRPPPSAAFDKQPAQHPAEAEDSVREHLARFGNTDFELHSRLDSSSWTQPWFVPSSLAEQTAPRCGGKTGSRAPRRLRAPAAQSGRGAARARYPEEIPFLPRQRLQLGGARLLRETRGEADRRRLRGT